MDDVLIIKIMISYCVFFLLHFFVITFVHERVHLYTLRFFGGDGYIGKCEGSPAVIHTTTVANHNQRIIVSLAPMPFDMIINFFAFYILVCSLFGVTWIVILFCVCNSVVVSLLGESFDIKRALEVMKLKKEGTPLEVV